MDKLSKKHHQFLTWLARGNFVDICTMVGRQLGKTVLSEPYSEKGLNASVNSCLVWGLLVQDELHIYGIRWSRLTLSEKGREFLKQHRSDTDE